MDDSENISANTWDRATASIRKLGYMDGAADGQTATFQSSFDKGYKLGLGFGIELGIKEAMFRTQKSDGILQSRDSKKINCQMCLDSNIGKDDIVNLFNNQKEKNEELVVINRVF